MLKWRRTNKADQVMAQKILARNRCRSRLAGDAPRGRRSI